MVAPNAMEVEIGGPVTLRLRASATHLMRRESLQPLVVG